MARRLEIRNKRQKPIEKQTTDWRLGSWNCRSLNFLGFEFALAKELQPRNFDVVALQEVCLEEEQVPDWPGRQTNSRFYLSGGKDKKLGTGFIVRGDGLLSGVHSGLPRRDDNRRKEKHSR